MATVTELVESRELSDGDDPAISTRWLIDGTDSELVASITLRQSTPLQWPGTIMLRRAWVVTPIGDPTLTTKWYGDVSYAVQGGGSGRPPERGEKFFNFDTGSGSETRLNTLETKQTVVKAGVVAPNVRGGINVTKEGVDGVDVLTKEFRFSETHYFGADEVSNGFIQTIKDSAVTVNSDSFRGFSAGEVMFVSASGSRRGTDENDGWEINFNFTVRGTIAAGTKITEDLTLTAAVDGWDYIWVSYDKEPDNATKQVLLIGQVARVERIYDRTDFAILNIGTDPWGEDS